MFRSSTGLAILDIAFWTNEAKVIKTVVQHAPTNSPEIPRMRNSYQDNGKIEFALWEGGRFKRSPTSLTCLMLLDERSNPPRVAYLVQEKGIHPFLDRA